MHELGIMTGVMDAVTTSAQQAGATARAEGETCRLER